VEPEINPYQPPAETAEITGPAARWANADNAVLVPYHQQRAPVCALCGSASATVQGLVILKRWDEVIRIFRNRQAEMEEDAREVALPLCLAHRSYRRWWPYSAMFLFFWPVVALLFFSPLLVQWWSFATACVAALIVAINFAVFVWFVRSSLRVYQLASTRHGVVLGGLAPAFVQAIRQLKQADTERVKGRLDDFFRQL